MYEFKVKWCPVCNQGWVEIVQDKVSKTLFLCCTECETEWVQPDEVNVENGTQNRFGLVENPSKDVIESKGWERYIINE